MKLAQRNLSDLQGVVDFLAKNNDLIRVRNPVDLKHELVGIAKRFEGQKPVLFEKVKGQKAPVLIGLLWNREILARIFGTTFENLSYALAGAVTAWQRSPIEPVVVSAGPANEVVEKEVDLTRFPIPWHALKDGGMYIDSGVFIARDPATGVRNASIHRAMVAGKDKLTMLLDLGRHLRSYYERAEAKGKALPLTISIGVDPAVYMASIIPASGAPMEMDELGIASELLGEPLKLIKGKKVNVEGVANAQYIIEGELLPKVRDWEGPFAELTGYYGARDKRWVVKVKAITRRRNPIYHTILAGKEIWNSVGLLAEAAAFRLLSNLVPGVAGVYFSHGGCGFYHAIVRIKKGREGIAKNAIVVAFSSIPALKMVTVVDDDVDIYNPEEVEWAMATRFNPDTGLVLIKDAVGHELNPSTRAGLGTKIGFDATVPFPKETKFERVRTKEVDLSKYKIDRA